MAINGNDAYLLVLSVCKTLSMQWCNAFISFFSLSFPQGEPHASLHSCLGTRGVGGHLQATTTNTITSAHFLTSSWMCEEKWRPNSFLSTQSHRKPREMILFHKGTEHALISLVERLLDYCHWSIQVLPRFFRKCQPQALHESVNGNCHRTLVFHQQIPSHETF